MKKLKKVAAISLVTMCFFNNVVLAETKEISTATRVRKEASTDSKIITVLYPGNDVEVLETEGDWTKIQRGEYIGYVKTEYLKKLEDKDDESEIYNTVKNEVKIENKIQNKVEDKVQNNVENKVENKVENNVSKDNFQTLPENKVAILIKTELHILPNFFSREVLDLDAGTELEIIDTMNNWYKVKLNDGKEGWILKSKTTNKVLNVENIDENNTLKGNDNKENSVITNNDSSDIENKVSNVADSVNNNNNNKTSTSENKKGIVDVETANVRKEATTNSKRIGFLDKGDIVSILSEENGFYRVKKDEVEGYVSKDLISVDQDKVSSRSLAEERKEEVLRKEAARQNESAKENQAEKVETENVVNDMSKNGVEVATYAKQFLGIKYVLGGKTPETGFDCAGFTKYVYKEFGVTLGSIASAQNTIGTDVARENLKVGDLILFQNEEKTKIGHTGIYLGNGEFIHAANPERGVVIDNINEMSYYNTRFVNAKRIVE